MNPGGEPRGERIEDRGRRQNARQTARGLGQGGTVTLERPGIQLVAANEERSILGSQRDQRAVRKAGEVVLVDPLLPAFVEALALENRVDLRRSRRGAVNQPRVAARPRLDECPIACALALAARAMPGREAGR